MRISDWSSDVCSSDLLADEPFRGAVGVAVRGVDEVAAAIDIRVEDAARLSFIGAPAPIGAKRHCAERHRRNPEARTAEKGVSVEVPGGGHGHLLLLFREDSLPRSRREWDTIRMTYPVSRASCAEAIMTSSGLWRLDR